jgi:hypothetical protein
LLAQGRNRQGAAQKLAQQPRWFFFLKSLEQDRPNPAEALRVAYTHFQQECKRDPTCQRWAQVTAKARAYHVEMGTLNEWYKSVEDFLRNPHHASP